MKIYYAKRSAYASFHIHAGSHADIFYVPFLNIAFGLETSGTFGSPELFVTEADYILAEGFAFLRNEKPKTESVVFSNIQDFDWYDIEISDLVQKLKEIKNLKQESNEVIKKLMDALDISNKSYEDPIEPLTIVSVYISSRSTEIHQKIQCIKYFKEKLEIGLVEAKNLFESLPKVVFKDINIPTAKIIISDLETLGITAEMRA